MKVLFIGGTGTISTAITALCAQQEVDLTLLNRGTYGQEIPDAVKTITCDIEDEETAKELVYGEDYDVVVDFIAFTVPQVERDIRLFSEKTKQFIFISSASAYQKPLSNWQISERTPVANPFWTYSQDKIACEERLMAEYREKGFPVTIVRPSHTYGDRKLPGGVHGRMGSWQVFRRMQENKPVIVHGDGLSLWAFMYNKDFARGFMGLMGNPHAIGETVQITADEVLTWNQSYRIIGEKLGVVPILAPISSLTLETENPDLKGSLIGDKANSLVFDNSKLKALVPGFEPAYRFDQGAEIVLSNILAHPELQPQDPEFDRWSDQMIEKYCPAVFTP